MADQDTNTMQVVPIDAVNERFDRMEKKLDRLSDAMIDLARTEEKIIAMEADRSNMTQRLNGHSEKIDGLNDKVNENTRVVANIVKLSWIIVGALVAVGVKAYLM